MQLGSYLTGLMDASGTTWDEVGGLFDTEWKRVKAMRAPEASEPTSP